MSIILNGSAYDVKCLPISIASLLGQLQLPAQGRLVEVNQQIFTETSFNTVLIKSGDIVEIVEFMGGG